MNPIRKIFGTANERRLKKLRPVVDAVNAMEAQMKGLTDEQLKAFTPEFKQRLENGASLDDIMVEAFAVVRETSMRTLGMRPFDCQLIGGKVLQSV